MVSRLMSSTAHLVFPSARKRFENVADGDEPDEIVRFASETSHKESVTLDCNKLLDGSSNSGVLRHIHGGRPVHEVLSANLIHILFHRHEQAAQVLDGVPSILAKKQHNQKKKNKPPLSPKRRLTLTVTIDKM